MDSNNLALSTGLIKDKIFTIRDTQVMLDKNLAELYGVQTKVFNQAVKKNIARFPEDFRFQLTKDEYQNLTWGTHAKYLPYVFTEQGVSMLSAVLKSDIAVEVSIKIVHEFVHIRKFISQNTVYHLRASLKDLGKKWFAFSVIDKSSFIFINKVKSVTIKGSM